MKAGKPPPPAANDEQSALANLKSLLVGEEQVELEHLRREAGDPRIQSARQARILPQSLRQAYADAPADLEDALSRPVAASIERSVRRNPDLVTDILYPVMGPAIRRSISHALKGLVQQINQTLDYSLSLRGLRWRMQAARSGVPFAEFVLRETLRYRVEEVFLIQPGSGLLIAHLGREDGPAHDADAVSAMLTAIRDFAGDTLDRGGDNRLETVDVGEHTLWLVNGPRAYLAAAIRGVPPAMLRDEFSAVLESIHASHGSLLADFDGEPDKAAPLRPLLETCLRSELNPAVQRGKPWPLILLLGLVLGALAWWGHSAWQAQREAAQQRDRVETALQRLGASPGVVVTDWRHDAGGLAVRGLHDPLTPAPDTLLQDYGLPADRLALDFQPYQSMVPGAVLERARRRLQPPEGVDISLDAARTLGLRGLAPTRWIEDATLLAATVPGVEQVDLSGLRSIDSVLRERLETTLAPPEAVSIMVEDGYARLQGEAPLAWIRSLPADLAQRHGLTAVDAGALRPSELARLQTLVAHIEETGVPFPAGVEIEPAQVQRIATLAVLIEEAAALARDLGQPLQVEIVGHTDGTGTPEQNYRIALERAAKVAQALRDSGGVLPPLTLRAEVPQSRQEVPDPALRRAGFRVLTRVQPGFAP